jgi:hypothetical protein
LPAVHSGIRPRNKETLVRHISGGVFAAMTCTGLLWVVACSSLTSEIQNNTCTQPGTIVVGDTLRDSVTSSSCHLNDGTYVNAYRFQVAAQTKLRVSLSSPLHRAFLLASDSVGVLIANTSLTSPVDTAATLHLIVKAGSYALTVSSYDAAPSGPLRLVAAPDTSAIMGCLPVWVTHGITTTQTITATACTTGPLGPTHYSHTFLTVVLAGSELKVGEQATGFVPEVLVVNQAGTTLATSAVDSTGAAQVDYVPGADAAVLMWVGSSDQYGIGPYTLTIH